MLILAEIMISAGAAHQLLPRRAKPITPLQPRIKFSTHPCALTSVPIHGPVLASSSLPESCPQNGDLPKSPFAHLQR